jgi:arabinose-5-phosphate isomerase
MSDVEQTKPVVDLSSARRALQSEGQAILALAQRIGRDFEAAAGAIYACTGQVVLTGIGKAGLIAQKISATLASTGTHSIFLHPVEALHGDLGRLQRGDVVLALSHSGATEEIIRLIDHIKSRGARLLALTGSANSPLARHADITLCYGEVEEACPLGLAPTVSTTCMLALGDALALTVMRMRNFMPEDFAAFHPGGELGRKLMRVEEAMLRDQDDRLAIVPDGVALGAALRQAERSRRRVGAMILVDAAGRLSGILTDADLRRALVKADGKDILQQPVAAYMTADPKHIHLGELVSDALAVMNRLRIDELPVVDADHHPVGLIDVQDLLGIKTLNEQ